MNYKSILFYLGVYSLAVSFFSFLNILYSIYFNFKLDLNAYLMCLILSFTIGIFFCVLGYRYRKEISLSDQIILIILTFFFIPLLISIPYFLSIYDYSFINSYFESVSGFTTTGFSIIDDVNSIDQPLLLWRSTSQWFGGLFFIIAIIGTLGSRQIKIKPNYLISDFNYGGNFYKNFNLNTTRILTIYILYTILIIFLYNLMNIRLLDSLNLAFTVISSGGFISKNNLSSLINQDSKTLILGITLLIPIFNYLLLFKIFTFKCKLQDHQEDIHLFITILLITIFFYFLITPEVGISNIFLSVATSLSTSGIISYTPKFDVSLFYLLLTILGGSLLSTASGLKYVRFYILLKKSYQEIYLLVKPKNIFNQNLFNSDSKVDDNDTKIAFLVFISFIVSIFILSSILTFDNISFENSFKLSILTLTNTVSSALYGMENIDFVNFNIFTKLILIVFMILGKIEVIAVLFLTKKFIFKE